MKKILSVILVLSISIFILLSSLQIHAFSLNGYMKSFKELNIDMETGKTFEELEKISKDLIAYIELKGGNELLRPHFNEREILHMEDVQVLFKCGFIIRNILLLIIVVLIIYFLRQRTYNYLFKTLSLGLTGNWIILLILGLMIKIDFNKYFTYFHLIFFDNDLWLLDPNTDLMIQMLPEKFFINIVIRTITTFILITALLQVGAFIGYKKTKDE